MTGTGLIDDPYLISTPEDIFAYFDINDASKGMCYGKLTNNIDCKNFEWNVTLSRNSTIYQGHTLDLNNYYIANIYMTNENGMFAARSPRQDEKTIIKNGQLLHIYSKNTKRIIEGGSYSYYRWVFTLDNVAIEIQTDGQIAGVGQNTYVLGSCVELKSCHIKLSRNKPDYINVAAKGCLIKDSLVEFDNFHIPKCVNDSGNAYWFQPSIIDSKVIGKIYNEESDEPLNNSYTCFPDTNSTGIVWDLDSTEVVTTLGFSTSSMVASKNNIINTDKAGGQFANLSTSYFIRMTEEEITSPTLTNSLGFTTIDITEGGGK